MAPRSVWPTCRIESFRFLFVQRKDDLHPPWALPFSRFASFSICSAFLYIRTENTSVVVVFCNSSRNSRVNWYSCSTFSRNSFWFRASKAFFTGLWVWRL
jgi:hypothetical protein